MQAIAPVQTMSQTGMLTTGTSFIRQTMTKAISAAVSNFEPNSLAVFVRLATQPSAMSETPAATYSAKNVGESALQNKMAALHKILTVVMAFARFIRWKRRPFALTSSVPVHNLLRRNRPLRGRGRFWSLCRRKAL